MAVVRAEPVEQLAGFPVRRLILELHDLQPGQRPDPPRVVGGEIAQTAVLELADGHNGADAAVAVIEALAALRHVLHDQQLARRERAVPPDEVAQRMGGTDVPHEQGVAQEPTPAAPQPTESRTEEGAEPITTAVTIQDVGYVLRNQAVVAGAKGVVEAVTVEQRRLGGDHELHLLVELESLRRLPVLAVDQQSSEVTEALAFVFQARDLELLGLQSADDLAEDGYPLVEGTLRGLFGIDGVAIRGRMSEDLPRTGELNPDIVRSALGLPALPTAHGPATDLSNRPPALLPC